MRTYELLRHDTRFEALTAVLLEIQVNKACQSTRPSIPDLLLQRVTWSIQKKLIVLRQQKRSVQISQFAARVRLLMATL
jgi:hypothetical protein